MQILCEVIEMTSTQDGAAGLIEGRLKALDLGVCK